MSVLKKNRRTINVEDVQYPKNIKRMKNGGVEDAAI